MDGMTWPKEAEGKATRGMIGGGFYDTHSTSQLKSNRSYLPHVRKLVDEIGVRTPEFGVIDFGCGPGHSALESVGTALRAYRELTPDGPVSITHMDQAGNDWSALFGLVTGPEGYAGEDPNLRVGAAVGSFYEKPMAAPGSIDLAMSFNALHWASGEIRAPSPGTCFAHDLPSPAREELAAFAEADWTRFLRYRASEMRSGGGLLLVCLGALPDPEDPNGRVPAFRWLLRQLGELLEEMAADHGLDRDVVDGFVFPFYMRTAEEARRPFEENPVLRDAFEIAELRIEPAAIHFAQGFAHLAHDPEAQAEAMAQACRAFAAPSLRDGVFARATRDPFEAEALTDELFVRLRNRLLDKRDDAGNEIYLVRLVLRRR